MKIKFSAVVILCWTFVLVSGTESGATVQLRQPEPPSNDTTPSPPTTPTTPSTTPITPPTTPTTPSTTPTPPTTPTTPSTTTTPPPTTTVKPSPVPPVPEPTTGTWMLNGTNTTCIVIKMAVQFQIKNITDKNKPITQNINLPMENMTQVIGDCTGKIEQNMTISWKGAGANNFTLHFVKTDKTYALHHIEAVISREDLPNISSNSSLNVTGEGTFNAHIGIGNSYKCLARQDIILKTGLNGTSGFIKVSNLQFQAFKTDKTNNFGSAEDCVAVGDIVPIAVGCVLIALVVLVLVAYLIGRRRSQARGYLSM